MNKPTDILNLLIFDTSDNTSELFVRKLAESGLQLHCHRESEKAQVFDAIKSGHWDMVLLNDEVRELGPGECIACIRQYQRHMALIVLTAKSLGAQELALAYRQGVAALVSLDHPEYSCAAVAREFHALRHHKLSSQLQFENSELTERCHALMGSSMEAVAYVHEGMHVHANAAYMQKFRFADVDEVLSMPFIDLVQAKCRPALKEALKEQQKLSRNNEHAERKTTLDIIAADSAGSEFPAQFVLSASQYNGEEVLQVLVNTGNAEQARLKEAASADAETGLYNRQYFLQQAEEFIEQGRAGQSGGGMLLCAVVNGFDRMRTDVSWEHADNAMLQLARYMKEHCGDHDLLARLTDNSLAMLIRAGAGEDAKATSDALLIQLAQFRLSGNDNNAEGDSPCTAVCLPIDAKAPPLRECLTQLLQRVASLNADAPPTAQEPKLAQPRAPEEYMVRFLGLALAGNQAALFHQPVISVGDIETELHDIELRIRGPEGELLACQQWQPCIGNNSQGLQADRWQLETALPLLARLQYDAAPEFMFTLTSATLADPGFQQWLTTLAGDCDAFPAQVILNVSAAQIQQDPFNVSQQLQGLGEAGFRICVSGPFEGEEICQMVVMTNASFARFDAVSVRHLLNDETAETPFSTLVETLQRCGCRVIVGGADDNKMLSLLWQLKVDLMQGTYFGHDAMEVTADAFFAMEAVVHNDSDRQINAMGG